MSPKHILLVEDSEGDILLIREALEHSEMSVRLSVVKDGKRALDFLARKGDYSQAPRPDLILLDINLPKKNGYEVLQFIKGDENLKEIPVIMLTTSSSEMDVIKAYKNYANCYIVKPLEAEEFIQVITKIENFWIPIVTLPGR